MLRKLLSTCLSGVMVVAVLLVPQIAFADTNEPTNNTAAGATVLSPDVSTTSQISTSTDVDFFRLTASTTGQLIVDMTPATGKNYDVEIQDQNGTVLASGNNTAAGGAEHVTYPATIGTTYYLRVFGVSGAYTTSYSYSIKFSVDPEPDDTPATAAPLRDGAATTGRISSATDVDHYALTAGFSGRLSVKLAVPTDKNYDVKLLAADGVTTLAGGYAGTGTTENFTYQVQSGTLYYLKVYGVSGAYSATSIYTLTATLDQEPNDSTTAALAVSPDTDILAKVGTSTDSDYYTFTAPTMATGKVRVLISLDVPAGKDYNVSLTEGSTLRGTSSGGAGVDESLDLTVSSKSKCYIRVFGVSSAYSTTDNYVLRYSLLDTDDNPANAVTTIPGYAVTDYISQAMDVDYWKVDAEAARVGGALDITFTPGAGANLLLDVVNTAGSSICSSTTDFHCDFAAGSIAYFKISSSDGTFDPSQPYTLNYDFTPDVNTYGEPNNLPENSYPITVDQYVRTYKASLPTDADDDFYKFTAPVSGNFHLWMSGSDSVNYDYYLYDITGGGVTLVSLNYDDGTNGILVGTVTANRLYQIRVMRASGSASGQPYTFKTQITDELGESNNDADHAYRLSLADSTLDYYSAKASGAADVDYYWTRLPFGTETSPGQLVVVVTASGATTDKLEAALLDATNGTGSMVELAKGTASSSASAILKVTAMPDQIYMIRVTSISGTDHKYTFTTEVLQDYGEPNESYETPGTIPPITSFTAYISDPVDDDNYIFTANRSGMLTVTIRQAGPGTPVVEYDSYLYSMTSTGDLGTLLQMHYGSGIDATLSSPVTQGSKYMVRVRRSKGHGAPYTLTTTIL